jgi:FSR family fosmidomycin resistance protein-like MFS transporter
MRPLTLEPLRLLRQPPFLAVSLSHFAVDVYNGQTGILLAVLSTPLGLTNAAIGLVATGYSMVGALSQPMFGWLADRYGSRWATAGGVMWMAILFALVGVLPGAWAIPCLVMGALGSGAFHPPGAMKAAQVGQQHMAGKMATAASIFFLFGQGGLSLGPAIGGALLDQVGRAGLLILALVTVPIGLFTAWAMRSGVPTPEMSARNDHAARVGAAPAADLAAFCVVMFVSGLRVWAQMSTTTFTPKFLHDQAFSPTVYGAIVATFMGGSAVGGVLGAILSERWGQRRTITWTLCASAVPFFFLPLADGLWAFPIAVAAGALNGASHSILVTMAQRALPGRAAMASGIILGFMFSVGALGTYVSGLAADTVGLARVLQANAALSLTAALAGFALHPERAHRPIARPQAGD